MIFLSSLIPSVMRLPIETYAILKKHFGDEDARALVAALETWFSRIEAHLEEQSYLHKLQMKEEIRRELREGVFFSKPVALGREGELIATHLVSSDGEGPCRKA